MPEQGEPTTRLASRPTPESAPRSRRLHIAGCLRWQTWKSSDQPSDQESRPSGFFRTANPRFCSSPRMGRPTTRSAPDSDSPVHAVKFHLSSVVPKLGVANRTEAAVKILSMTALLHGDSKREGV